MSNKTISVNDISSAMNKILDRVNQDELQVECGKAAVKVAKKYMPKVRSSAKGSIKHSISHHPYVSTFTAKQLSDSHGVYGAAIWNKNYQLSHLVEKPHGIWNRTGSTHNNYYFFAEYDDTACNEFKQKCIEAVRKKLSGK